MKKLDFLSVLTRAQWAVRLNGVVNGQWINIAAPGHRPRDRSLGILFDADTNYGFCVNPLAGDDPAICRAHVKKLLAKVLCHMSGGPALETDDGQKIATGKGSSISLAQKLWSNRTNIAGTIAEKYLNIARQSG